MLTLRQAFSTAAALQSAKTQIKLCEACPMHSLHKLCERIEGTIERAGAKGVRFGIWEMRKSLLWAVGSLFPGETRAQRIISHIWSNLCSQSL